MSEENVSVEATEAPEEVLETLRKGEDLKKDLAARLGTLKEILNGIEKRAQQAPVDAKEDGIELSLLQVERSIIVLDKIHSSVHTMYHIGGSFTIDGLMSYNKEETKLREGAIKTMLKINKIYDSVVDKLGK